MLVELENVITVYFEDGRLQLSHLVELCDVVRGAGVLVLIVVIIVLKLDEGVDEVFEFDLNICGVDICAPQDLLMRTHIVGALELSV